MVDPVRLLRLPGAVPDRLAAAASLGDPLPTSTLLLSTRNVLRHPAYSSWFCAEDLAGELLDARIQPVQRFHGDRRFDLRRHLPGNHSSPRSSVDGEDVDLAIFITSGPFDMAALRELRLSPATRIVTWVVETWPGQLQRRGFDAESFRGVDAVYAIGTDVAHVLGRAIGRPVGVLPPAVDVLAFRALAQLDRPVLAMNPGRRDPRQHAALRSAAASRGDAYIYDTMTAGTVADHQEHRHAYRAMAGLSRLVVSNFGRFDEPEMIGNVRVFGTRIFEACAAGALPVGTFPSEGEFEIVGLSGCRRAKLAFDATDEDVRRIVEGSDALEVRESNLRVAAISADWAHRFARILRDLDLEPSPALLDRLAVLDRLASAPTRQRRSA